MSAPLYTRTFTCHVVKQNGVSRVVGTPADILSHELLLLNTQSTEILDGDEVRVDIRLIRRK